MKRCCGCHQEKPFSEFHRSGKDPSRKEGYNGYCKPCVSAYTKRRYHQNLDFEHQRSKKYYQANRLRIRQHQRDFYARNIEKERQRNRAKRLRRNELRAFARVKKFNEQNPDIETFTEGGIFLVSNFAMPLDALTADQKIVFPSIDYTRQRKLKQRLKQLLQFLNEDERELLLDYFDGHEKQKNLAAKLGVKQATISWRIHKIVEKLKGLAQTQENVLSLR